MGYCRFRHAGSRRLAIEERNSTFFDIVPDGILIADPQSRYLDANPGICRMLGYSRAELVGMHASDIVAPGEVEHIAPALDAIKSAARYQREWIFRRKDGTLFDADVIATTLPDGNLLAMIRDISASKARELELQRINQLYAALSHVNQSIVRSRTREALLQAVCQALVEHGGFDMAWIGWHDPQSQLLLPIATRGDKDGYLDSIQVYGDDRPAGRGPIGTAFRSGRPCISNDLLTDATLLPWLPELKRRNYRATATFPIRMQDTICATLTVYSHVPGFFQDREIELLAETAGDISHALDNLMHEQSRRDAETTAQAEKLFSDTIIDSMPGIVYFYDETGRFLRWNRNFEQVSGYAAEEIERMHPLDFFSDAEKPLLRQRIDEVFEQGDSWVEAGFMAKDGSATPYLFTGRRVTIHGAPYLAGVGIDISERIKSMEMLRLLNSAVMQSRESIMITDATINLSGPRIVFANPAFTQMTGYDVKDVIGKTPRILQGPKTDRTVVQRLRECLERGEPFEGKAFQYRKDGSEYQQEWRVAPIRNADAAITHFVAIQHDITERQQAADRLLASEREQRQLAQQLEIERSRLIAAQRVAKVGSWETDLASMDVIWSDETHRIHETDPASYHPTHQSFLELVHPEDRALVDDAFTRALDKHEPFAIEHRLLLPDGRIKHLEERWQIAYDASGHPLRAIGTCQDISERKLAMIALQESTLGIQRLNRVLAVLSEINALIVRVSDRQSLYEDACRIAVESGGFRMAMICMANRDTGEIVPVASAGKPGKLIAEISRLLSSSDTVSDTLVAHVLREKTAYVASDLRDDPKVLLSGLYAEHGVRSLAVLPLVVAGDAIGVIALYGNELDFFHVEEMKLLSDLAADIGFAINHIVKQERLDYLAYYDSLTGLANRTLFLERIAQYMRSNTGDGSQLALFLFDLERFKNINDTLGRACGDMLLQLIAQWLSQNAGDASLLARIDADHFAFVLPKVRQDGDIARLLEQTMERFLEHPFIVDGHTLRIAAKAGVAYFPDNGDNADTLFKHAETALKFAKSRGERYLFFDKSMIDRVADNLVLENRLRQARRDEEFVLHYQPKVNLKNGQVVGAEALIRWNDPETGLVPPGRFIPVLEETGLIHDIGRWAVHKAIKDYLHWCDSGLTGVRIAVNVSPLQLRKREFIDVIRQLISVDPRAANGLELEITESMIMEDVEHGIDTLRAIRALGVHIALDDFGTGFSSLSHLSRLPLDVLKVDRSFVYNMTTGPDGFSVVSNIITLAHSLKLSVVAEGVETEEQERLLRSLKCDEMQGFLFSKPVPIDVFEARFLARTTDS